MSDDGVTRRTVLAGVGGLVGGYATAQYLKDDDAGAVLGPVGGEDEDIGGDEAKGTDAWLVVNADEIYTVTNGAVWQGITIRSGGVLTIKNGESVTITA